ncbi:MAG: class I SAM-dependent methyltransferase [Anaerolineales bacterium]
MELFKSLKTLFRKIVLYPFGYDLVPLAKSSPPPLVARPSNSEEEPVNDSLKAYIEWFGEEAVGERRFYNLGAEAGFTHPAWTVINHPSEHYGRDYMDIQWDLMSGAPLPIEDGKAKVIFSRYTLEHVTDAAVSHFLSEARRVLAKGGFLRLIVPDIDLYYAAYRMKDADFFYRPKQDNESYPNRKYLSNPNQASFEQRFLWNFASSATILHPDPAANPISDQEFQRVFSELGYADALNFCTAKASIEIQRRYPENHINWFNATKVKRMLTEAGFEQTYRSGYGQSHCPVLRDVALLEARQPEVGLFFEAVR